MAFSAPSFFLCHFAHISFNSWRIFKAQSSQVFNHFALAGNWGKWICLKIKSFFSPSRPIIEPIGDFKTLLARCDVLSRECGKRQFKLAAAPWGRIWRLADLLARSLSGTTKGPFRLASAWDHLVPLRLAYLLSRIEIISVGFQPPETVSGAVLRIRIHMFLGLPYPDPLVRGMDPDPDPSIIKQK